MIVHKTNFNKFNRFETTRSVFSEYNGIKLEISSRKVIEKYPNTCKLNNTLLSYLWAKGEVSREI